MSSKFLNKQIKRIIGLANPKLVIIIRYFIAFKRFPNLSHPEKFSEKINVYKLQATPDFARLADKVAVKEYVTERIGGQYVIPTIYAGKILPAREERIWPLPYVVKMNHGSGFNILVRTEAERNWPEIEKKIAKWSKKTFGRDTGEVHYSDIEPQVLVEAFLSADGGTVPKDYKFFVFSGIVEFIEVVHEREIEPAGSFYDRNWQRLPISLSDLKAYPGNTERPETLNEMVRLAEALGQGFPLVRVDLYDVSGKIFFGEMTFTPSAGFARISPPIYDTVYGKKFLLSEQL